MTTASIPLGIGCQAGVAGVTAKTSSPRSRNRSYTTLLPCPLGAWETRDGDASVAEELLSGILDRGHCPLPASWRAAGGSHRPSDSTVGPGAATDPRRKSPVTPCRPPKPRPPDLAACPVASGSTVASVGIASKAWGSARGAASGTRRLRPGRGTEDAFSAGRRATTSRPVPTGPTLWCREAHGSITCQRTANGAARFPLAVRWHPSRIARRHAHNSGKCPGQRWCAVRDSNPEPAD